MPTTTPQRSRRREKTRSRLLDAARDVFAERGVAGGSVEEICERAGFTRGAFYSNFEDKDQLLSALLDREEERLVAQLAETIEIPPSADMATLGQAVERFLDAGPIHRKYFLIENELATHAIREPALAHQLVELHRVTKTRVGDLVTAGMAALGRELTVPLDDAVETILAIVTRSHLRSYLAPAAYEPKDLAHAVLTKVLTGLSRPR